MRARAVGLSAGAPPAEWVVAQRARIGNQAVARVLARQYASKAADTSESAARRAARHATLERLAAEIDTVTKVHEQLSQELERSPRSSQRSEDAEHQVTLEREVTAAEDKLQELLTKRGDLLDEGIAEIAREAGGNHTDPAAGGDDIATLREQRQVTAESLRLVQRRRAKHRIDVIGRTLSASDPAVANELDRLGRLLASTARKRTPAGTAGKDSQGRGYVVYSDHVKVGGNLPWRNNNPGNVNGKDVTDGVIGWNPEGIGFHIFTTPEQGAAASGGWWKQHKGMRVGAAIFAYSQGRRSTDDPEKAALQDQASEEYTAFVEKEAGVSRNDVIGALSPDKFDALLRTVRKKEGEGSAAGPAQVVYTCGPGTPDEYEKLLGCDE